MPLVSTRPFFINPVLPTNVRTLSSTGTEWGNDIAVDPATGDFYIIGRAASQVYMAKYNITPSLQWQYLHSANNGALITGGIEFGNTANNVYGFTDTNSASGHGGSDFYLIRRSGDGVSLNHGLWGGTGTDWGYDLALDSSDNVYVTGRSGSNGAAGSGSMFIAKYDASLNSVWQKHFGNASGGTTGRAIAVNKATGDVFIVGESDIYDGVPGGFSETIIVKLDTNGVLQWDNSLETGSGSTPNGIAVDASGNCFISTQASGAIVVAKYNGSGILQWQRQLSSAGSDSSGKMAVDNAGNIYVVGTVVPSGNNDVLVAKYDTNGNLQWKNTLSGSGDDRGYGIANDGNNFYVSGLTDTLGAANPNILIMRFPNNGSGAGTYGTTTYGSASSVVESAASLTANTGTSLSLTNPAPLFTEINGAVAMTVTPYTLTDTNHT